MKCLKEVFKCASSVKSMTCWKWAWYTWAYTRNRRLRIVLAMVIKFLGKDTPGEGDEIYNYNYLNCDNPKKTCLVYNMLSVQLINCRTIYYSSKHMYIIAHVQRGIVYGSVCVCLEGGVVGEAYQFGWNRAR